KSKIRTLRDGLAPAPSCHFGISLILLVPLSITGCADVKRQAGGVSPPPARAAGDRSPEAATPANTATVAPSVEWQPADENLKLAFEEERPIFFASRAADRTAWDNLPHFWNSASEKIRHPLSQKDVERQVVKIKLPLGLTQAPPVPPENPMTVHKWELG